VAIYFWNGVYVLNLNFQGNMVYFKQEFGTSFGPFNRESPTSYCEATFGRIMASQIWTASVWSCRV